MTRRVETPNPDMSTLPSEDDNRGGAVPSHRHYHPYQDLKVPITNLYTLPTSPEYLFHEESIHHHRSWGENLQYYTGTSFLLGALSGGVKGTVHGVRSAEPGDSLKIRVNRVLNEGGKMVRSWGNSLGVLGLLFAGVESGMVYWRGTDDMINSVVAGLGTGALYKAAAGPRSAAIAGAIGGIAAGVAVAGKQAAKRYVPI